MADVQQRRILTVLTASQILAGVGVATGIAVSSLIAARLSGSDLVGGAAFTALVLGAALASYPVARVATRYGRRPALSVGYAVGALGAAGVAMGVGFGSWPAVLAAMVPFGAATSAGLAARFAATDLAAEDRRARALGLVVWAATVGAVAGPNLAEPAQRAAAWAGLPPDTGPFLLCVVALGLAAASIAVGLRPDPLLLARHRAGEAATADAAAAGLEVPVPVPSGGALRALRAAPGAQVAVAGIVLCHLVMIAVMSMTPVHMNHGGASLQVVGLVISLHVAGMYGLSPVFGWLADRLGRYPVLAIGATLLIVGCVLAATSDANATGQLTAGLVALGLGWSAGLIGGSALLTDSVPLAERAAAQGLSDVAMNVSGVLGGLVAGVTVAVTSYPVLGFAAAVVVVPFLLVLTSAARRVAGAPAPV